MIYYDVITFVYGDFGVGCSPEMYRLTSAWIAKHRYQVSYGCYLFSSAVIS